MQVKFVTVDHPASGLCSKYFLDQVLQPLDGLGWIAGGAIRDWFLYRKCKSDIDVWFPSQVEFDKAKALAGASWTALKETEATANYRTEKGLWVQLVKKHFFSSLEETLAHFDFTVCTAGCHLQADGSVELRFHPDFFVDLAMKRLAINALPYPVATWKRSAKYMEKGFRFCPDQQKILLTAMAEELLVAGPGEAESRYME